MFDNLPPSVAFMIGTKLARYEIMFGKIDALRSWALEAH